MKKKGLVPKDHMKENRKQLKEFQTKNKDMLEASHHEPEPLYKLSQFQNIDSRVFEESTKAPYREGLEGEFLRKGQSENRQNDLIVNSKMTREQMQKKLNDESNAANANGCNSPRKASVPHETAKLHHRNTDYINRNKSEAVSVMKMADMKKTHVKNEDAPRHESFGKVPTYLEDRKSQWAAEEEYRRINAPDPDCPRGMVVMPEAERVDTLNTLKVFSLNCQLTCQEKRY